MVHSMTDEKNENGFSRIVNLERITKSATVVELEADANECVRLAERFSIAKVVSLKAECSLKKRAQKEFGDYLLGVKMDAVVVQECVMSLEEVNESISEKFTIIFQIASEKQSDESSRKEIDFNIDDDDIELISEMDVDVGAYIAEYLSLSISLYPRQSKVLEGSLGHKIMMEDEVTIEEEKKNPFAVLKDLKHNT